MSHKVRSMYQPFMAKQMNNLAPNSTKVEVVYFSNEAILNVPSVVDIDPISSYYTAAARYVKAIRYMSKCWNRYRV